MVMPFIVTRTLFSSKQTFRYIIRLIPALYFIISLIQTNYFMSGYYLNILKQNISQ